MVIESQCKFFRIANSLSQLSIVLSIRGLVQIQDVETSFNQCITLNYELLIPTGNEQITCQSSSGLNRSVVNVHMSALMFISQTNSCWLFRKASGFYNEDIFFLYLKWSSFSEWSCRKKVWRNEHLLNRSNCLPERLNVISDLESRKTIKTSF